MFKKGDRVEVVGTDSKYTGCRGIVGGIQPLSYYSVRVDFRKEDVPYEAIIEVIGEDFFPAELVKVDD